MAAACRARPRVAFGLAVCLLAACGGADQPIDARPPAGGTGGTSLDARPPDVAVDSRAPDAAVVSPDAPPPSTDAAAPDAAPAPDVAAGACGVCATWGQPQLTGRITTAGLDALSGMAASWRNPGVLYVHNDRDRPIVFAFTESGDLLGRYTLNGATVRDIEDMAVGRCPAGTCIYLADIGNNISPRTEFAIYRASEPAVDPAGPTGAAAPFVTIPAERFAFSYADGAHNAESLIIDHATGDLYIVTKEAAGTRSAAYRLETFTAGQVNRAVKLADLPIPAAGDSPVTSGTGHPCAPGLLLRTNGRLYELRAAAGAPFADVFKAAPTMPPAGAEQQGEAVTFHPGGRAYYTTSEGGNPPIHKVSCP